MKIKIAKTAGFCMGVKRAIEMALEAAKNKPSPVLTLGPLIHNDQAVEMLSKRGIKIISEDEEPERGTLIIRAHGVPLAIRKRFENRGLEIVDATCPHVLHAQHIVWKYSHKGYQVIICGDKDHAEVQGLLGYCLKEGMVIKSEKEAKKIKIAGPVCLLAQTTFNKTLYEKISQVLRARIEELLVFQTICNSTSVRQSEAGKIAKEVEAMIVVGGHHSANTRRLAEISKAKGALTFHIETAKELDREMIISKKRIGVTAGASTPSWITYEVISKLSEIGQERELLKGFFRKLLKIVILSNFYAAVGAASLTYISSLIQQIPINISSCLISASYIFSIYVLNRRREAEEEHFFMSGRVIFYQNYSKLLFPMACLLMVGSLLLSFFLGLSILALLSISYGIGLLYSFEIIPKSFVSKIKLQRLKDIPASKDIFVAAAWTMVSAVIPFLSASSSLTWGKLLLWLFIFLAIFAKAISFDLADVASDRLIGKETTPALMGRRKTEILLLALIGSLVFLIWTGTWTLAWPKLGFLLVLIPACLGAYLFLYHRRVYISETSSRFFLDGMLILLGLSGLVLKLTGF